MPRESASHGTKWARKKMAGPARAKEYGSMENIVCRTGETLCSRSEVYVGRLQRRASAETIFRWFFSPTPSSLPAFSCRPSCGSRPPRLTVRHICHRMLPIRQNTAKRALTSAVRASISPPSARMSTVCCFVLFTLSLQ